MISAALHPFSSFTSVKICYTIIDEVKNVGIFRYQKYKDTNFVLTKTEIFLRNVEMGYFAIFFKRSIWGITVYMFFEEFIYCWLSIFAVISFFPMVLPLEKNFWRQILKVICVTESKLCDNRISRCILADFTSFNCHGSWSFGNFI